MEGERILQNTLCPLRLILHNYIRTSIPFNVLQPPFRLIYLTKGGLYRWAREVMTWHKYGGAFLFCSLLLLYRSSSKVAADDITFDHQTKSLNALHLVACSCV